MSEEHICQKYGGQCECFEATLMGFSSPVGRQCELCPFYNYYSINGCKGTYCHNPMMNICITIVMNYSLHLS